MIAVTQAPPLVTLSAARSIFVVSGSLVSGTNYRYVAESEGQTFKCDKLPTTQLGFFDVGNILKDLVVPVKPAYQFIQNPMIAANYSVAFKEEYGAPPVIASGSTTASGIVLAGFKRQYETFPFANYLTSGTAASMLTRQPLARTVRTDQHDFNSILLNGYVSGLLVTVTYPLRSFTVSPTYASGSLAAMIDTGLAGLDALTSGQTSDGQAGGYQRAGWSNDLEYDAYQARAEAEGSLGSFNPCARAIFDSLVDFDGGNSYAVSILVGSTNYGTINYSVDDCNRFVNQLLYFRNSLGGVDSFNFKLRNRLTGNIEKNTFGKNSDVIGSTTFESTYHGSFQETWRLVSDYLRPADSLWLQDLIYTPEAWLLIDGQLVEAQIVSNAYQFFQAPQDKLNQLIIDAKIAYRNETI